MKLVTYRNNELCFNFAILNHVLNAVQGYRSRILLKFLTNLDQDGNCKVNLYDTIQELSVSQSSVNATIHVMKNLRYNKGLVFTNIDIGLEYLSFTINDVTKVSSNDPPKKISIQSEALKYFVKKYEEEYNIKFTYSYPQTMALFRDKICIGCTIEEIKGAIDIGFEEYNLRWKKAGYTMLTPVAFGCWIFPICLDLYKKRTPDLSTEQAADDVEKTKKLW